MQRIDTPSAFRLGLGAEGYSLTEWFRASDGDEARIRPVIDGVFRDLQHLCADGGELAATSLDWLEEPLSRLAGFGLELGAVCTTGSMTLRGRTVPWRLIRYFVAQRGSLVQGRSRLVHLFGADCPDAERDAVDAGAEIQVWPTAAAADLAFEGRPPGVPVAPAGHRRRSTVIAIARQAAERGPRGGAGEGLGTSPRHGASDEGRHRR